MSGCAFLSYILPGLLASKELQKLYLGYIDSWKTFGASSEEMVLSYGISHIQLTVWDLERSIRFYQQILGMMELSRHGEKAVMLRTPNSHEVFTLNADPALAANLGQMGGIAHFGFRLSEAFDIAILGKEVEEAGGTVIESGTRGKDKKETYLFAKDPDGYEVEFFWMP